MEREHHFIVGGTGRYYDFTTFCKDHYDEAFACATEWLGEAVDGLDVGERCSVEIECVAGPPERCYECNPEEVTQ